MEGYKTICAKDGREGYNLALSESPDLILTELGMPDVDGVTMIKMIRNEPHLASIPIVVLTAHHSSLVNEALASGANEVTFKPVIIEQLFRTIKRLLPKKSNDTEHKLANISR